MVWQPLFILFIVTYHMEKRKGGSTKSLPVKHWQKSAVGKKRIELHLSEGLLNIIVRR